MELKKQLSRANFLRASAVVAASAGLAACSNGAASTTAQTSSAAASSAPATSAAATSAAATSAAATSAAATSAAPTSSAAAATTAAATTTETTIVATTITAETSTASVSGKYKESPLLAAQVQAGKLPPVDQRLPEHPYVVPHPWLTTGKYGGKIVTCCSDKSDFGTGKYLQESMYGHSLLRWLKDGLAIVPGLVESWDTNSDQSEWTLHFRKGLKWSDGKPWTTADIMFWWEDEVQNPDLKEYPPDEAHSGKGTLMTMTAPDDTTIVMKFDSPTPLTADRLAMWVKRGIGPRWMDPKHYLQQFHPKYNPSVNKNTWVNDFLLKREFANNPDCPTMTGWMLTKYAKGQYSVWASNPYYWCVDKEGNQLPYLDGVTNNNIQDPQVMRLTITQGKIDYLHGAFTPLTLADISTLKAAQAQSNLQMTLWDGGDGTGSAWFFNYDYYEPKMRALIRNPKFRQALSLAMNRDDIQKSVYFNTGESTTGTMSPKAIEFHTGTQGPEVYKGWRDSFIKHDPETAKSMLDSIGVKMNGQWRTMPDGSPLKVTLDYQASDDPNGAPTKKNELVARDWKAIGINAALNPVTPTSWNDLWSSGKTLNDADWGVGDGPNCLVYPQWLVPIENTRWAPLEGQYYTMIGTKQENDGIDKTNPWNSKPPRVAPEKGGPVDRLWTLYNQTRTEPDQTKRNQLVWEMAKIHTTEGPFFTGTVANTPAIVLFKNGLKNVPTREDLGPKNGYQSGFTSPWIIPSPAVYDPETYYWDNPDQHNS